MKYPEEITINFQRKRKTKNFDFLKKRTGLNSKVFINFKKHDVRSGILYVVVDMIDYGDDLEFKLNRCN